MLLNIYSYLQRSFCVERFDHLKPECFISSVCGKYPQGNFGRLQHNSLTASFNSHFFLQTPTSHFLEYQTNTTITSIIH